MAIGSTADRWSSIGSTRRMTVVSLMLGALAVALVWPVIALLGVVAVLVAHSASPRLSAFLTLTGVSSVFVWMNVEKVPSGDWVWYTLHFRLLDQLPLSQYMGHIVDGIYVKPTEPVYYFATFVLSRLTHGNVAALAASVTLTIYGCLGGALWLMFRDLDASLPARAGAVAIGLTALTFSLTTQLVREEIALSLAVLGSVLVYLGRRVLGATALVLAVGCHNSSVVFLGTLALIAWTLRQPRSTARRATVAAGVLFALGSIYAHLSLASGAPPSNGSVSFLTYGLDGALLVTLGLLRHEVPEAFRHAWHFLLAFPIIFAAFLAGVSPNGLALLRIYFYMEPWRAAAVAGVSLMLFRRRRNVYLPLVLAVGVFLYATLKIAGAPYDFHGGLIAHMSYSPFLSPIVRELR